jgi:phosphate transport system substrate-binding protein
MNKSAFLLILTIVSVLVGSCGNSSSKEKEPSISISGAFALYPLAQKWAEEYNKTHPKIRFDIQAGGAGKGLTDVISGAVDVGMFSREITDAEKRKGVWWIALCKDAVLPTINSKNPYIDILRAKGLTRTQLESIFTDNRPNTWDSLFKINSATPHKITVYTRADAAGAADSWASFFGKKQEDLKGIGVAGDPAIADAVRKDKNAIGYNNTLFVYDIKTGEKISGMEVVPIDLNTNGRIDDSEHFYTDLATFLDAVNAGRFPSPPARHLYFITKGRPHKQEILDFFKWVLTDGQKLVHQDGYVPLHPDFIHEQIRKVAPGALYEN